jgi:hypothetical protein
MSLNPLEILRTRLSHAQVGVRQVLLLQHRLPHLYDAAAYPIYNMYPKIQLSTTDPDTLERGQIAGYYADATINDNLTVDSPFAVADLQALTYVQSADTLFFAHPSYPPYKLERYSHYSWRFSIMSFTPQMATPEAPTAVYSESPGASTRDVKYAISAINAAGEESLLGPPTTVTVDSPWESGAVVDISWAAVVGATLYNVWKNSRGSWGLIGTTQPTDAGEKAEPDDAISGGDLPFLFYVTTPAAQSAPH